VWRLEEQAAVDAENEEVLNEVIGTAIYNEPDAAYYSEPQFPTRKLPPVPSANHTNGPIDNTAMEMTDGVISNEPQISPEISSNVSPTSVMEAPYSGLESSTREPPSSPASYDSLVKPVYVNTNFAASELTNDIICDDSGVSKHRSISTSSEAETTM